MLSNQNNHGHSHENVVNEVDNNDGGDYQDDVELQPGQSSVHLATIEEKKRLWWRNALITSGCIASWFLFATLLSLYNKWMFSEDYYGFSFPLFVTCLHMWIQFCFAALVRLAWPGRFRPPERPNWKQYGVKVVPIALATAGDIGLSNTSLTTITLSFYTMIKNSTLIFVLIFAFLFRLETFSWRLIGVIFLILVGVVLMVATETSFSVIGFILVISASASGGLRWSLTQLLLRRGSGSQNMGMDTPPAALFWMTPAMGIILALMSMSAEGWFIIFQSRFFAGIGRTFVTLLYILIPGTLAFCMVLSEFYIIQKAGVLPMSVAGIVKEVATISFSAWVFGDQLTPLNITGVGVAFCGIVLFTYHKYQKSLQSKISLDSDGNLIENASSEDRIMMLDQNLTSDSSAQPLFVADSDNESDDIHPRRKHSLDTPKSEDLRGNGNLNPFENGSARPLDDARSVIRESMEIERLWDEQRTASRS